MAANLDWTDAAPSSRILQLVSPVLLETAALAPIAFEAHHFGIWLPDFECALSLTALKLNLSVELLPAIRSTLVLRGCVITLVTDLNIVYHSHYLVSLRFIIVCIGWKIMAAVCWACS